MAGPPQASAPTTCRRPARLLSDGPVLAGATRRLARLAALLAVVATFVLIPLGVVRDEGGTIEDLLLPTTWADGLWGAYGLALALVVLGSLAVVVRGPDGHRGGSFGCPCRRCGAAGCQPAGGRAYP